MLDVRDRMNSLILSQNSTQSLNFISDLSCLLKPENDQMSFDKKQQKLGTNFDFNTIQK